MLKYRLKLVAGEDLEAGVRLVVVMLVLAKPWRAGRLVIPRLDLGLVRPMLAPAYIRHPGLARKVRR